MNRKGYFITFEGGEGAGKTTLIQLLHDYFKQLGEPVIKTREPGGTFFGEKLRAILLDRESFPISNKTELLLFLADRSQHVEEVLLPALQGGKIVLCDRFNDSTLAYQGAGRALSSDFLETLLSFSCDNLEPDVTFYLDIPPMVGLNRLREAGRAPDRIEKERLSFHELVRQEFLRLAKKHLHRIHVIDGTKKPSEVYNQVLGVLRERGVNVL